MTNTKKFKEGQVEEGKVYTTPARRPKNVKLILNRTASECQVYKGEIEAEAVWK
jgi:hypothetical protein